MENHLKSSTVDEIANRNENILNLPEGVSKMDAIRAFAIYKCTLEQRLKKGEFTNEQIEEEENLLVLARNQCLEILSQGDEDCCEAGCGCGDENCDEDCDDCCDEGCGCCGDDEEDCCNEQCGNG